MSIEPGEDAASEVGVLLSAHVGVEGVEGGRHVADERLPVQHHRAAGDAESQPEADPIASAADKQTRRAALLDALTGRRTTQTEDAPSGRASFDGGARETVPPPPPSHGEWLAQVLRTRAADQGANVGSASV